MAHDTAFQIQIIALHTAQSKDGAEFYPSCTQITVAGDNPSTKINLPDDDEVTFPGAYKDTDPGILIDVSVLYLNFSSSD